jgi:hypothetical protein
LFSQGFAGGRIYKVDASASEASDRLVGTCGQFFSDKALHALPSVWTAIEERSHYRPQLTTKAFAIFRLLKGRERTRSRWRTLRASGASGDGGANQLIERR